MNDVELYGNLIREFIRKMTSPDIGEFRMEISSFRIILERARVQRTKLIKFNITENGRIVNDMEDDSGSISALETFLRRSVDFISSLIGEELARDVIYRNLKESTRDLIEPMRGREGLIGHFPEPFDMLVEQTLSTSVEKNDHEEVLGLFEDVFQAYLKELSGHTDLSAFKLKLSILREKHRLLKHVTVTKNNSMDFDRDIWATATDEEVSDSLVAVFNSMVGLSTFLLGKEEAIKKASRILNYYFEGKASIMERYGMEDLILEGALNHKVSTGFQLLDDKMGGGISKGSSILFISPSGIERDIFITQLLTTGLMDGASVLMVLSKEPPRSIRMLLRSQDLDANAFEEEGKLRIVDWFSWRGERIIGVERDGHSLKSSKILSNLGIAINKGLRDLTFSPTKIAIVHMIGPATNIFEFTQVYNFMQRLRAKFKEEEMASIFFLETETLSRESLTRIMEVFDGVVEMKKTMGSGKVLRDISILTMSGMDYDTTASPFVIRDSRLISIDEIWSDNEGSWDGPMDRELKDTDVDNKDHVQEEIEEAEVELSDNAMDVDQAGPIRGYPEPGLDRGKDRGQKIGSGRSLTRKDRAQSPAQAKQDIADQEDKVKKVPIRPLVKRKKKASRPGKATPGPSLVRGPIDKVSVEQVKDSRGPMRPARVRKNIDTPEDGGKKRTIVDAQKTLKPKRVRKIRIAPGDGAKKGRSIDISRLESPEDILKEAISTIEDLLEGSEPRTHVARRPPPKNRT
ncbi:MAG: hypothetical protein JXA22_04845 [Candidatus Thermoplasmatota archaeon]|nr:hypothetical protein [Candidatus Thermoplasmatota archaeon]